MKKQFKAGEYKLLKGYKPFSPSLINTDIEWQSPEVDMLLQEANTFIGKLNAYSDLIPDIDFFIHMYAMKEATTSNRIEGTRTTFDEAISPQESISPERIDDWQEVQNYTQALNSAIENLNSIPLSIRLLKEAHQILLQGVRGKNKNPGEVRKTQNWIGGSSLQDAYFIPPEPNELADLLSDLEKFLHNDELLIPDLIKAGVAHYQFETIHPFLDGNGRVGRLLIILYLVDKKILSKPVLYISHFFEKHRSSYYDALSLVKTSNSIDQWLKFFLKGIVDTSKHSIETFDKIIKLRKNCEQKILADGRRTQTRTDFLNYLYSHPTISAKEISETFNISVTGANKLIKSFIEAEILVEKSGLKRNRYFVFEDYLKIFRD